MAKEPPRPQPGLWLLKEGSVQLLQRLPGRLLCIRPRPQPPSLPRPCACSLAFGQTPEIALARGSGEQHSLTLFPGPSDSLKKKSRYTEISGFCSPFGSDLRQAFWAWLLRKLKKLLRDLLFLLRFPHSSVLLYRALPAHATLVYLGCIPCTLPIFVPVRNEARTLKRQ